MDVKMWGSKITRSELQETIRKLHLIRNIPHLPRENLTQAVPEDNHCLSFSEEQDITSKLAFISAASANSLEVMAVCFEEEFNGEGATIRIASNTGVPPQITNSFRKLAEIMMRTYRRERSRSENTEDLFHQIVDMDFCRILSRLRSRHVHGQMLPNKIRRCGLFNLLKTSLADPSIKPHSKLTMAELDSLRRSANELGVLFNRLELIADVHIAKNEACVLVKKLLRQTYDINKSGVLVSALGSSKLNPNIVRSLPETLGKVGKYYSISSELISAARKRSNRIFHNIKVEPISVSKPDNVGGKVHAEIQLLFFYESNLGLNKPRVICSSKSACYLCNIFFEHHGGFFMPRTHGKLYPKWTLPDWLEISESRKQDMRSCLGLLKATLECEITKASTVPTRRLSDPAESVLLPSAYWPSSTTIANQILSPHASTSTIRPLPSNTMVSLTDDLLLLTPPLTPEEPTGCFPVPSTPQERCSEILPQTKAIEFQEIKPSPSSLSICSIDVTHSQFPYSQPLTSTTSALYLNLDGFLLSFEFTKVVSGQLLIDRYVPNGSLHDNITNLEDIPTTEELQMPPFNKSNTLVFHLQDTSKKHIRVEIVLNQPLP